MEELKKSLGIPMYVLHYIDSIEELDNKIDKINFLKQDYSLDDRKSIFMSLEWAMLNKETNFKEIMSFSNDRFSNDNIFQYLEKLYLIMKKNQLNIR